MADKQLSALTAASAIADANLFYVEQSGNSRKATGTQLKAYTAYGGGGLEAAPTAPASASFTLQNAGTAALSDVANGMLLSVPSATSNIRFAKHTAGPSSFTSFTMTWRAEMATFTANVGYTNCGILRDSGTGKIIMFGEYQRGATMVAQRWSSYTAFSANAVTPLTAPVTRYYPWRRMTVASGTITFYVSVDGVTWISIGTEPVATYITTINEVGVGSFTSNEDASTVVNSFTIA